MGIQTQPLSMQPERVYFCRTMLLMYLHAIVNEGCPALERGYIVAPRSFSWPLVPEQWVLRRQVYDSVAAPCRLGGSIQGSASDCCEQYVDPPPGQVLTCVV